MDYEQLKMNYKNLKNGNFRWRKKFRYLPSREKLIKELGVVWLANRLFTLIHRYMALGDKINMLRVEQWEFLYIIQINTYGVTIEIIQKEPFKLEEALW